MTRYSGIAYHLRELEIARNPQSPFHTMPEFSENDQVILDIGCGFGQTFAASKLERGTLLVGLDIDFEFLSYGHHQFDHINFVNGAAECLPFQSDSFDLVFSRVSLPYTNIPQSLTEIARVLKENGRVWLQLHRFSTTLKELTRSILEFEIKSVVYLIYVIVNGVLFHLFGRQFALPVKGSYESFQTVSGMGRSMKNAGFTEICFLRGRPFICTARRRGITRRCT